jgi:hypothetical protein
MQKISEKEVHPAADIFPAMSVNEFSNLCNSIQENGQREPILLYKDKIIDGRHRYQSCKKLEIEPRFLDWEGDESDILAFVIDVNLHRRHLSESQRGMVAVNIANLPHGANRFTVDSTIVPSISQTQAAEMMNVSIGSVKRAKQVQDKGTPELAEQVSQGNISASAAATIADLPDAEQTELIAKGKKEILAAAKAIRAEQAQKRKEELALIDTGSSEEFGANDKKQIKWLNILHDLYRVVNSFAHNGGVVSMTASWSQKRVDSLIDELENLENKLKASKEELKTASRVPTI